MADSRDTGAAFRQNAEDPWGGDNSIRLWFLTMDHAGFDVPLRFVCEDSAGSYTQDGDVVGYLLNGNEHQPLPYSIETVTDTDGPPIGRMTIPNIDRRVGIIARNLKVSPRVTLELYLSSDWDMTTLTAGNMHPQVGTPTRVGFADWLRIKRMKGDIIAVEAELGSFDLQREPYPNVRTTQDRTPGSWWGP